VKAWPAVSRRRLLLAATIGSAFAAAAAAFGQRVGRPPAGGDAGAAAGFDDAALFAFCTAAAAAAAAGSSGGRRRIGEACLRALPAAERSAGRLSQLILDDLAARRADSGPPSPPPPPPDALRQAISERSRSDFCDGRIISVDGWLFSLTEARVYAFAALTANDRLDRAEPRSFQAGVPNLSFGAS
jgi:hypothetical protein